MQNLYALKACSISGTEEDVPKTVRAAQKQTLKNLEESSRIFIQLLYSIQEVAQYADRDARQRASKRLPTKEDLNVSTKIAQNPILQNQKDNEGFQSMVKEGALSKRKDASLIKLLYGRLCQKEEYKTYIMDENSPKVDKTILSVLFNDVLMEDEDFDQYMDDQYMQWQDDKGMMKILVMNYLNKSASFKFDHLISKEKKEYALELIRTVIEKRGHCLEWIKPRLQNWDPERVAMIDMLLLHMGICEFLYFPSIPPREVGS